MNDTKWPLMKHALGLKGPYPEDTEIVCTRNQSAYWGGDPFWEEMVTEGFATKYFLPVMATQDLSAIGYRVSEKGLMELGMELGKTITLADFVKEYTEKKIFFWE